MFAALSISTLTRAHSLSQLVLSWVYARVYCGLPKGPSCWHTQQVSLIRPFHATRAPSDMLSIRLSVNPYLESQKGKFIAIFWAIFNMGGVVGSAVAVGQNFHSKVRLGLSIGVLDLTLRTIGLFFRAIWRLGWCRCASSLLLCQFESALIRMSILTPC